MRKTWKSLTALALLAAMIFGNSALAVNAEEVQPEKVISDIEQPEKVETVTPEENSQKTEDIKEETQDLKQETEEQKEVLSEEQGISEEAVVNEDNLDIEGENFTDSYELSGTEKSWMSKQQAEGANLVDISVPVSADYGYKEAFQVLNLVNQERAKQGVQEVKMDRDLLDAAMLRAAETSIYFSHTRPTGMICVTACAKMTGENIAAGMESPEEVMNIWMNSSGHRANILAEKYQSIGIGVAKINNCFYWVQCFGSEEADEVFSSSYQNKTENTEIMISENDEGFSPVLYMSDTVMDIQSAQTVRFGFDNGFFRTWIDSAYVDFSSSDEKVCTISGKGEIKALSRGDSTIRASLKGYPQISCESVVQIRKFEDEDWYDVEVSQIRISGMSRKIAAGKKMKLTAKILPDNATYKKVVWRSSNKKVATVNSSGVVTVKKGSGGKSVTITAKAMDGSGVKATYKITSMKGIVKKVSISGKKSVKAGKTLKLKGKVKATKSANKKLKWTSSNKKYATVTSTGKVKAFKAGKGKKVKITAKATDGSGKKKTITIKIK